MSEFRITHTHLATTHSTNSQLIEQISASVELATTIPNLTLQSPLADTNVHYTQPHLLTASSQSGGRGQHGRSWQSPVGNVYLSLYLPNYEAMPNPTPTIPYLRARLDGRLSLCVAMALVHSPMINLVNAYRTQHQLPPIGVKWVNDLGFYEAQQFQKLAGILIEPVTHHGLLLGIVVGVGVNLRQAPILSAITQEGLSYQAISIADLLPTASHDANMTCEIAYPQIQQAIIKAVMQFNALAYEDKLEQFLQQYRQVDVLYHKRLQITSAHDEHHHIKGVAAGIDRQGSLQIIDDAGVTHGVWSGTISMLD